MKTKVCLYCEKEFTPDSRVQKYCTHGCALAAKRERDIKVNKERHAKAKQDGVV